MLSVIAPGRRVEERWAAGGGGSRAEWWRAGEDSGAVWRRVMEYQGVGDETIGLEGHGGAGGEGQPKPSTSSDLPKFIRVMRGSRTSPHSSVCGASTLRVHCLVARTR